MAYSDLLAKQFTNKLSSVITSFWSVNNRLSAYHQIIELAKKITERSKMLFLINDEDESFTLKISKEIACDIIFSGSTTTLCEAIANSADRLAAIFLTHTNHHPLYYKKSRELASAEGAMLVLDTSDKKNNQSKQISIPRYSYPDIIICNGESSEAPIWIGSKQELVND